MNERLRRIADDYFRDRLGVSFETLLAPIAADAPAGADVRANGVYRAIREARRQDDASLPLGLWEHELKRADWPQVVALSVEALQGKTKDLQLVAWSIEALIHMHGFAALAPALALFVALCESYWRDIYPPIEAGDQAYRTNLVQWLDTRLAPTLRQVPFAPARNAGPGYGLDAWERARRNEQLRAKGGAVPAEEIEGVGAQEFAAALAAVPVQVFRDQWRELDEALLAVGEFDAALDTLCPDAPRLHALGEVLSQARAVVEAELKRRGVVVDPAPDAAPADDDASSAPEPEPYGGVIRDRHDAYLQLAQAAEFLQRVEPHSPVPYLVRRAIDWGGMNTAELYHRLFVVGRGQIDIMDLLGIAGDGTRAPDDERGESSP